MKWIEVKITTTPEASEAVSGILYDMGIGGLYIEDPRDIINNSKQPGDWDYLEEELTKVDPDKVVIRAYFPEEVNYAEKISFLEEKMKTVSQYFDIGSGKIEIAEVFEKDWANNWKKYYKPIKIGARIVVKPTWEEYHSENPDEIIVEMDPGMAFGTGTHETTRMCIELIEKYVESGDSVLDVGCGSGILGITALKLGAGKCIGVDIDENAVHVAKENTVINGVEHKIEIRHGNLLNVVDGQFDVIVANIIADVIIELSAMIKPYLKIEGVFIASGIIHERYDEVKAKLQSQGFVLKDELFLGEWVAVAVSVH